MKKNIKEQLKKIHYKVRNKIWLISITLLLHTQVYAAEGSISTAEVNQATENIKNAVIKLRLKPLKPVCVSDISKPINILNILRVILLPHLLLEGTISKSKSLTPRINSSLSS